MPLNGGAPKGDTLKREGAKLTRTYCREGMRLVMAKEETDEGREQRVKEEDCDTGRKKLSVRRRMDGEKKGGRVKKAYPSPPPTCI